MYLALLVLEVQHQCVFSAGTCLNATEITVEPPKKGHFGNGTFVLSSEVVLISEVQEIF